VARKLAVLLHPLWVSDGMSSACRLSVTTIYENGIGFNYAYQVAAVAEMRTPNLHGAKIAQQKSADGRMATEAAQLKGKKPTGGKRKTDLTLTSLLMEGLGRSQMRNQLSAAKNTLSA